MQQILDQYGLNTKATIEPIGNGLINHTYKITTSPKEVFVLQQINTHVFPEPQAIDNNIRCIGNYLQQHYPDYLFTHPLRLPDGRTLLQYDNSYYRMFPFVQGSHSIDIVSTPEQAYEAAVQFGKFTAYLSGLDSDALEITLPDFHNLELRYAQFETALQLGNQQRIAEAAAEIEQLQSQQNIVYSYQQIKNNPDFKRRIAHHDTKISNTLFDAQEKAICVIDLDTVMPGYFISDLGDMFRTYLSPANEEVTDFSQITVRKDYYDAIVKGYLLHMESLLTSAEKKQLHYAGSFMMYMQALRFLTDYLNNDSYYGARYEKHNFNRAKNQLVLLQQYNNLH